MKFKLSSYNNNYQMKDLFLGLIFGLIITFFLIPTYDIIIFDNNITFVDNKGVCYQYKEKSIDNNNDTSN